MTILSLFLISPLTYAPKPRYPRLILPEWHRPQYTLLLHRLPRCSSASRRSFAAVTHIALKLQFIVSLIYEHFYSLTKKTAAHPPNDNSFPSLRDFPFVMRECKALSDAPAYKRHLCRFSGKKKDCRVQPCSKILYSTLFSPICFVELYQSYNGFIP